MSKKHYSMWKNYPHWVCSDCGKEANTLTCLLKYGQKPHQVSFSCSTYHKGICGVCKEEKRVTEARDFFYPDFKLIERRNSYGEMFLRPLTNSTHE